MKVYTTKGLVDRDRLVIIDVITETTDARKVDSQMYLDGELVRNDVTISIWRPHDLSAAQGEVG